MIEKCDNPNCYSCKQRERWRAKAKKYRDAKRASELQEVIEKSKKIIEESSIETEFRDEKTGG